MRKSKIYNLSKEELQELLNNSNSYAEILECCGIKGSSSTVTLKRVISEYCLDTTIFEENRKRHCIESAKENHTAIYNIYDKLKRNTKVNNHKLKNKLIELGLKEAKCEMCGITEWLGQPVKFHLHHEDGDHFNNELSNLKILCPNCHSMTDNYGAYNSERYKKNKAKNYCKDCGKELSGKTKTGLCEKCYKCFKSENGKTRKHKEPVKDLCPICKIRYKDIRSKQCAICSNKSREKDLSLIISREELKNLIRTNSFINIGKMYNVTDNAVRKWCKKYNLPYKKSDINKYTDKEWENV